MKKTNSLTLNEKYFFACSFLILSPSSFNCSSVISPRNEGWDWNGACFTSTSGTVVASFISTFDKSAADVLPLAPSAPFADALSETEDISIQNSSQKFPFQGEETTDVLTNSSRS